MRFLRKCLMFRLSIPLKSGTIKKVGKALSQIHEKKKEVII